MRKLTCYAWGKSGEWEALCVDYDLAAQGSSFEEVRQELADAVDTFLDYVSALPESERRQFLNRKAPLSLCFRLSMASKISRILFALRLASNARGVARARFVMTPTV